MKTKNFFQIALVAGMMSVATMANAQTYSADGSAQADIDSAQVEFVTVGATLPYSTTQSDISAWENELNALTGFNIGNVASSVKWYGGATGAAPIASTDNKTAVELTWGTTGEYLLKAENTITIGGVVTSCGTAMSAKKVYVLPKPNVSFTAGDRAVLACNTTSHSLTLKAMGIGSKSVTYVVTRKPVGADGNDDAEVVGNSGSVVSDAAMFYADQTTYDDARDMYTSAVQGASLNITVDNLAPGYIYTVAVTKVSDQISRKSNVPVTSNVNAIFTVVPVPTATKINHVKNVE